MKNRFKALQLSVAFISIGSTACGDPSAHLATEQDAFSVSMTPQQRANWGSVPDCKPTVRNARGTAWRSTEHDTDRDGWSLCEFDAAGGRPTDTDFTADPSFDPTTPLSLDDIMPVTNDRPTFWVSQRNGENCESCGSKRQPFLTIQHAINMAAASPGADVMVKSGIYAETIEIKNVRGLYGDPTVIRAVNAGSVTLKGFTKKAFAPGYDYREELTRHKLEPTDRDRATALITVEDVEFVRIGGFRLLNSRGSGIDVQDARDLVLARLSTENTGGAGILVQTAERARVLWNHVKAAVQIRKPECLSLANITNSVVLGNLVEGRPGGKAKGVPGWTPSRQSQYIIYQAEREADHPRNNDANQSNDVKLAIHDTLSLFELKTRCGYDRTAGDAKELPIINECIRGGEGLDIKRGSQRVVIAYNIIRDIGGKFGLYIDGTGRTYEDHDGRNSTPKIQVNWEQKDLEIHHNVVTRSGSGLTLSLENGDHSSATMHSLDIHNNAFFKAENSAIQSGSHGGMDNHGLDNKSPFTERRIHNVTLHRNIIVDSGSWGATLTNPNAGKGPDRNFDAGIEFDKNIFWGNNRDHPSRNAQIKLKDYLAEDVLTGTTRYKDLAGYINDPGACEDGGARVDCHLTEWPKRYPMRFNIIQNMPFSNSDSPFYSGNNIGSPNFESRARCAYLRPRARDRRGLQKDHPYIEAFDRLIQANCDPL